MPSKQQFREAQLRHAQHYAEVLGAANEHYQQGGDTAVRGLDVLDQEWPNIQSGFETSSQPYGRIFAKLCITYMNAGLALLVFRHHPRDRIRWCETGIAASHFLGECDKAAEYLLALGIAYQALGENREAKQVFEKSLATAQQIGDRRLAGQALNSLTSINATPGQAHEEIGFAADALQIAQSENDSWLALQTLANLGTTYAERNQLKKALDLYSQAMKLCQQLGDVALEGKLWILQGTVYADLGELQIALKHYKKGLYIHQTIGNRSDEVHAHGNIAFVYRDLGDVQNAIHHFEQQLKIATELGDRYAIKLAQAGLARPARHWLWDGVGSLLDAFSRKIFPKFVDDISDSSTQEFSSTSQEYFDQARRIHNSLAQQPYRLHISQQEILSRQHPALDEAEELYRKSALLEEAKSGSLQTWAEAGSLTNAINAYLQLSLLYRQLYKIEDARQYANKALELLLRFSAETQQHRQMLAMKTEALFRLTEIDHFLGSSTGKELIRRYEEILAIDRLTNNEDGIREITAMLKELQPDQDTN